MNTFNNQFGLMVAYLLPGFIGLAGIAPLVPLVAAWLRPSSYAEASLGPPVYAILTATTIGMIVSCFRWLIIDHIHYVTGLRPAAWDDSRLADRLGAFNYLVESHYRYYQFLANTLIAVAFAYSINRWLGTSPVFGIGTDACVLILCAVLFAGTRDTLTKYYARTSRLVGNVAEKGNEIMINGNHHEGGSSESTKPRPETKPESKPQGSSKDVQNKSEKKQSPK